MSSYLTIYGKLKPEYNVEKPIPIFSVSRSHDLYQAFHEDGVTYIYKSYNDEDNEMQFTEITEEKLNSIKNTLQASVNTTKAKIDLIEKHLPDKAEERMEMLLEIENWQKYLDENLETLHYIHLLDIIVDDIKYDCSSFEKLLCNID